MPESLGVYYRLMTSHTSYSSHPTLPPQGVHGGADGHVVDERRGPVSGGHKVRRGATEERDNIGLGGSAEIPALIR